MSKRTTTSEFGRTRDVRVNRIHPIVTEAYMVSQNHHIHIS